MKTNLVVSILVYHLLEYGMIGIINSSNKKYGEMKK